MFAKENRRKGEKLYHLSNKKLYWLFFLWGGLPLILMACNSEQVSSTAVSAAIPTIATTKNVTPNFLAHNLPSDWLKGIPCSPPCWDGVIPGQHTAQEAVDILKKNPKALNPQIQYKNAVTWTTSFGTNQYESEALFDVKDAKQLIYEVRPVTSLGVEIKLKDVIQAYGMPTYVIALKNGPPVIKNVIYDATFFYITQGMRISTKFSNKADFNQNLVIVTPEFFIPSEEGFKRAYNGIDHLAVKWEGFKDFRYYCRTNELLVCNIN